MCGLSRFLRGLLFTCYKVLVEETLSVRQQEIFIMTPFTISLAHASYDSLDLLDSFDVIVLGGGPAGIAASTTAAEKGHRTLLIERLGILQIYNFYQ